jgi:hypothetical protein
MSFINPFEQVPQKKENPAIPALQIYEETVRERIRTRAFEPNDQVRERIKQLLH